MIGLLLCRALAIVVASAVGLVLASALNAAVAPDNYHQQMLNWVSFLAVGVLVGWLLGDPLFRSYRRAASAMLLSVQQYPPGSVAGALAGLTVGVVLGNLLALPVMIIIAPYGFWWPGAVSAVATLLGGPVMAAVFLRMDLFRAASKGQWLSQHRASRWLLDTSALLDGRLITLVEAGLLDGELVAPDFVVQELHRLSDSKDPLRRNRGRLGLGALESLKSLEPAVRLKVEPAAHLLRAQDVDNKLVELAGHTNTRLLTVDYNLAKVAAANGVTAVNLAEVSQALKPLILPGERMNLKIIKLGRESGQGVGYLEDGTMVVVDGGQNLVGSQARVEVTSIIQTVGGRLVFASPATPDDPSASPHNARLRSKEEPHE